jgi:hypothetical protein
VVAVVRVAVVGQEKLVLLRPQLFGQTLNRQRIPVSVNIKFYVFNYWSKG